MSDATASNREWCFICAGADDDPGFDECAVCGRKGVPLPYGGPAPTHGAAMHRPATGLDPELRPGESNLARGIRLARGIPEPEDVPGLLQAIGRANRGTRGTPPSASDLIIEAQRREIAKLRAALNPLPQAGGEEP